MKIKSKYSNIKVKTSDGTFDSKKEYHRWNELKLLYCLGRISNLQRQVSYTLIDKSIYGRKIVYKADFVYKENGITIIEDCKGFKTDVYKLKKRLLAERYGIIIKET